MQEAKQTVRVCELDFYDLLPIGMGVAVIGIAMSYSLSVQGDIKDDFITNTAGCNSTDQTGCGAAYNATLKSIEGTAKIPDKLPMIVTVMIAALIIGILVTYFMVKYR